MFIKNVIRVMKNAWEKWDVRGLMLLSLSLQTLLLVLAPLRKRQSNNWLIGSLLCLYLLADWTANYAAGVITSSGEGYTKSHKKDQPLAFWSTFLLVHLGGPDSITAFALQDNDFWHRHALSLVFQCSSATYIFFQTLAQNQVWLPTLLMFVAGFVRYYERTRALYSASLNNLRDAMRKDPDPGPPYAKMTDTFSRMRNAGLPSSTEEIVVPARVPRVKRGMLNETEVVLYAHQFFSTFKRLIVDLKCSYYERIQSREFFLGRTSEEAFQIIGLELNFMYDILFTKASVVFNRRGFKLRAFSSALFVISFGLFYYEEKRIRPSDVTLTYFLLLGALALDVVAVIQFITGNWLLSFTAKQHASNWLATGPVIDDEAKLKEKQPVRVKQWSESVSTHNLFDYCLHLPQPEMRKFMDWFGLSRFFDELCYVRREPFTVELRNHIFAEVKSRSELAEYSGFFEEAIAARGGWNLRQEAGCGKLFPYVDDMDYDESLLSWHIATELCWCKDMGMVMETEEETKNKRRISKLLSDYMMYLVAMQPAIMYGVTDIGETRLRDTRAEVQQEADLDTKEASTMTVIMHALLCFLLRATFKGQQSSEEPGNNIQRNLCQKILDVNTEFDPVCIKGDKSKSVLFHGCRLAKELEVLGDRKWEIMSKVWVEMLTYAAVHCRPRPLVEQLSKGGELISFVWLLMAHFGLVDHFEVYSELVRVKLDVKK